jgi:hypothetical protein
MKRYPVTMYRPSYRGADPKKRAQNLERHRIAGRVERHLNEALGKLPNNSVQVFLNYEVAAALRESPDLVAEIINGTDGGSNGITIVKGSFEKAHLNAGRPADAWDET